MKVKNKVMHHLKLADLLDQTTSEMKVTSKMKTISKIDLTPDVKPDMLSGVQTGNGIPHDRHNIRGIAHACTNRKDFHAKTTRANLYIYIGVVASDCKKSKPYPARAYTT